MREHDPVFEAWVARARAGSFERAAQICGFQPARGKDKGNDRSAGPCPECGGRDRFSVHYGKRKFNCRGCGAKGVDALALALVGGRVSFVEACEDLSGEPRPARVGDETPEEKAAREARRREADRRRDEDARRDDLAAEAYRERERAACHRIWDAGRTPTNDCLGRYFSARRLVLPASALIREADDVAFWHGEKIDDRGRAQPRAIYRGPAMLAQMLDNAGAFVGLHITSLAPDWRGKAEIFDPDTGEALPSKKMRGSKRASHIVVREPSCAGPPARLFLAEGIETAASVGVALHATGRLRASDIFWAAGDLGNLGGAHLGTFAHPALKTSGGRPQRVPSSEPDFAAPGIVIPPYVGHLVLLGDGDSEPVLTRAALERGRRRHAADRARLRAANPAIAPLAIGIAIADAGTDFNDMLRRAG